MFPQALIKRTKRQRTLRLSRMDKTSGGIPLGKSGFSLVELIVVLLVFSVMLLISIPSFRTFSNSRQEGGARSLAEFIQALRQDAVSENRDIFLYLDSGRGRAWAGPHGQVDFDTHTSGFTPTESEGEEISDLIDLPLNGVELPSQPGVILNKSIIRLSSHGYTDAALIRMEEGGEELTLKISPFFEEVQILTGLNSYHDCP